MGGAYGDLVARVTSSSMDSRKNVYLPEFIQNEPESYIKGSGLVLILETNRNIKAQQSHVQLVDVMYNRVQNE